MATSDWTFSSSSPGTNLAIAYGGTVPAPPGGGSYARSLTTTLGSCFSGFYPSDPSFSNIVYGATPTAIRIQCYFYRPSTGAGTFSIAAKNNPQIDTGGQYDGYCLTTMFSATPQVFLRLNNQQVSLQNSLATNTWHSWRLSVYPISSIEDRVIAEFESSPGSGVWSSAWGLASGDVTINGSTSNRYVPWGVRSGKQSRNGVWNVPIGTNTPVFIDLLQVTTANTPIPIP